MSAARPLTPSRSPLRKGLAPALAVHLFTLAMLLAWWAYARTMPVYLFPGPADVAARMVGLVTNPLTAAQLLVSLGHVGAAIGLSFVLGGVLAALATYVLAVRLLVDGLVVPFLNSFAGIGWLFLGLLWFGLTSVTVIFAVTMVLVPFVAINLRAGFQALDADLAELGRSLTRRHWRTEARITLPQLLPFAFAALRITFGAAWKVVLVSELFGGRAGAGYMMNIARQEFDSETIFAIIAFILIFVWAAEKLLFKPLQALLDRRFHRG